MMMMLLLLLLLHGQRPCHAKRLASYILTESHGGHDLSPLFGLERLHVRSILWREVEDVGLSVERIHSTGHDHGGLEGRRHHDSIRGK